MKFFHRFHRFILAVATIIGTIVGVGMFGLPYVASRTGIVPVIFYLVLLGGAVLILHLLYGEVVLRTKERHRLTGYAKKYFGKKGEVLAGFTFFFGLFGALLAYLVIGGQFLSMIVGSVFPSFTPFWGTLIIAALGFFMVYKGIKRVGFFEVLMTAVLLSLILGLLVYGSNFISFDNLSARGAKGSLFFPYGVVLFSLWGASVIPEIRGFFKDRAGLLKKAIILGIIIPIGVYLIFTITVVGISGSATTPDAISGLVPALGLPFSFYGALVGLLAVITSFIALTITIKDSFRLDLHFPAKLSLLLAFGIPLILFFLGARNFITIIDWVGVTLGGLEGALILVLHKRAQEKGDREPEYTINLRPLYRYGLMAILLLAVASKFL